MTTIPRKRLVPRMRCSPSVATPAPNGAMPRWCVAPPFAGRDVSARRTMPASMVVVCVAVNAVTTTTPPKRRLVPGMKSIRSAARVVTRNVIRNRVPAQVNAGPAASARKAT